MGGQHRKPWVQGERTRHLGAVSQSGEQVPVSGLRPPLPIALILLLITVSCVAFFPLPTVQILSLRGPPGAKKNSCLTVCLVTITRTKSHIEALQSLINNRVCCQSCSIQRLFAATSPLGDPESSVRVLYGLYYQTYHTPHAAVMGLSRGAESLSASKCKLTSCSHAANPQPALRRVLRGMLLSATAVRSKVTGIQGLGA